ncbi:MAG: ribonuclease HI [Helicobacter sp.]|uniref:Ribonuclease H n=2 Tax=Helicobacter TaxID=209 RepID=A0ABT0TVF0_9HELI|nr:MULTISPECIES: ribonuclease HI [Helicobacter]MCI7765878.1 ribonuclease HI [Helicobacter sp.]MCL9819448.1 ribonuclease HI [Helicobacter colisuis]MCL9820463.1 ribonuclease HI [Helicobacter colisuis]MCL9822490.1 ribonuclease HI [Helicobacter colisuis]MDY4426158.1 ribonuclease HI [Helicobacter sp.]
MKRVTLFCDGSSLGNPGYGGWCGILRYKDKEKIIKGSAENATNNQMELSALIFSLKALKEPCEVLVISDSKYVLDGLSKWLPNWIIKNFKNVKNPELWKQYLEVSKLHKIQVAWVKGHNGHKENELCDKIAKEEALKLKNQKEQK